MKLKELMKKLANGNPDGLTLEQYLVEDFVPNSLLKSDHLQQAFGISDLEMEDLYRQGYDLYQQDNFKEALPFFNWLAILNPFVAKYWMGLAACKQFTGDHENALKAYAMVTTIDLADPYPHFHAYECYEALANREDAIKALKMAYERATAHTIYQSLRVEIKKNLTLLNV